MPFQLSETSTKQTTLVEPSRLNRLEEKATEKAAKVMGKARKGGKGVHAHRVDRERQCEEKEKDGRHAGDHRRGNWSSILRET